MDIDQKIEELKAQLEMHKSNAQAVAGALQFAKAIKAELEAEEKEEVAEDAPD